MAECTPEVDLWILFSDGHYQHALSIPISECWTKSTHPLKWLWFIGFAIYGDIGIICKAEDGLEVEDYGVDIEPGSYYFLSEGKLTGWEPLSTTHACAS